MNPPMTFRDRMIAEIKRQGIKMSALARASGVHYDVIRQLVSGKAMSTSPENARPIARALGFSMDDYMPATRSADQQELLEIFSELPEEYRDRLIEDARILLRAAGSPARLPEALEPQGSRAPEE